MFNRLKCWLKFHTPTPHSFEIGSRIYSWKTTCLVCGKVLSELSDQDRDLIKRLADNYNDQASRVSSLDSSLINMGGSLASIASVIGSVQSFISENRYRTETWLGHLLANAPPTW